MYTALTCPAVSAAAQSDGLHVRFNCLPDSEKPRWFVAMVVAPGWEHAQVPVGSDVVTARRPRAGGPRAGRARTAHPERRTPVVQVFRSVSRWFQ